MTHRRIANPKYSRYTPDGKDYNPDWKFPKTVIDLWTAVIADANQPVSERDRAATCLRLYLAKIEEAEERLNRDDEKYGRDYPGRAEANHTVAQMLAGATYISSLWESPDDYTIEIIKGRDGVERTEVVRVKEVEAPEPTPGPAPTFEPAVPLPVLAPSAEEQKAVREMSLDERFSPGAVAARVAAIEKEAAEARRMRDGPQRDILSIKPLSNRPDSKRLE